MLQRLLRGALVLLVAAPVAAQTAPSLTQPLPIDSKVKIGTLPNGIRYYIRQNPKPEKRAELRLVVNAGSILEDDDQRGLAHFLEHTAFNGTTNFKKNELVSALQSIGVRMGADLNAYTGFDETVYILPVPTDTARLVELGFQILEDWAHGQVFDPTEVTNERGVVVEEWRGGKGAGERMLQKWLPIALQGSRYATRLPIGTDQSIMGATPEKLRRFYQDWYRPDLMAVVAVGDFDPVVIEGLIRKHFSGIKKPSSPRPRIAHDLADNRAPLVAIATDKEATSSNVSVMFKVPGGEAKTVGEYRQNLAERLYLSMLNNRFAEISQKPDAPFLYAGASKGSFVGRGKHVFSLDAGVKDGGIEKGVEAIISEARRVDQFGFLESELTRAKQNVLRSYERSYTERDKTESASHVGEYVNNFLVGEPIPGIEYENQIAQQFVPGITLAEINAMARNWITEENRIILVTAPEKEGVKVPTESELLATIAKAEQLPVVAWTETLSDDPLIEKLPAPGKVTAERKIASGDVTEWKLSNGARVLFKPTDFKADEILFSAYSPGGNSLVADADYMSAALGVGLLNQSGAGKFTLLDLNKKLSGKVARVTPSISGLSEGMNGSASPKDLEMLMQLVHLRFTAPRVDTAIFGAMKNQLNAMLANMGSDPNSVFSDTITVTMSQRHFRARPLTLETFAEVNPHKALSIYQDRFADASDFTFVFVGNVDPVALKPLVEQYLATLPALNRKETWKDTGMRPPTGVIEKVVRKGKEPKASTRITFTGPFEYSPENRFALRALTDLVQIKLIERLREQLGGTYSPSVSGGGTRIPRPEYSITVAYGSSPENVEKLAQSVMTYIDSLKANPPSAADVEKVKEQMIRARETQLKTNTFWLSSIAGSDQAAEDMTTFLGAYDQMIKNLTPAQIQQAAQRYFNVRNYARFILLPEIPKPSTN